MGLSDFGKLLVPPKNGAATPGVTQWRWAIFVSILLLLLNSAAGRGFLGGYGSYAAAADMQKILEVQFESLELQVATELRELQKQLCELSLGNRLTLERVIEDYQQRYSKITGHRYPLKSC